MRAPDLVLVVCAVSAILAWSSSDPRTRVAFVALALILVQSRLEIVVLT